MSQTFNGRLSEVQAPYLDSNVLDYSTAIMRLISLFISI